MGKKTFMGKGENAGFRHFSPFSTMFSKAFCFIVVQNWGLRGKELRSDCTEHTF